MSISLEVTAPDLADLLPKMADWVVRYDQTPYAQRKCAIQDMYREFPLEVAQYLEWIARVLSSDNVVVQVAELYTCATKGLKLR
jgi:hypothetical protein